MKRSLLFLLLAIAAAVWIGTLIAKDPGYVLIAYGGATLQSSLWVMLALVALLVVCTYYLMRLLSLVGRLTGLWKSYRSERQRRKSAALLAKGLVQFQEGNFARALRFLDSAVAANDDPAVVHLYAARAADAAGNDQAREQHLEKVLEEDMTMKDAVGVARAEMAASSGDWARVLSCLEPVKSNDAVARLRCSANLALKQWQALAALVPELRSAMTREALLQLQKQITLQRLMEGDDGVDAVYNGSPVEVRRDEEVVLAYCLRLQDEKAAEEAIRSALKQTWMPRLLDRYGSLGPATLDRRQKTAEAWLKEHADDAALQLCLGRIYEARGEPDKARTAYQKSVDIDNSATASSQLARMLALEGDYRRSNEYFAIAMKLAAAETGVINGARVAG
jgi:HemY protein